jgi:hypothetical protein
METITDNMNNVFQLHHKECEGTSVTLIACGIGMARYHVPLDDQNHSCPYPTKSPTFSTSFRPKYCENPNIGRAIFPI